MRHFLTLVLALAALLLATPARADSVLELRSDGTPPVEIGSWAQGFIATYPGLTSLAVTFASPGAPAGFESPAFRDIADDGWTQANTARDAFASGPSLGGIHFTLAFTPSVDTALTLYFYAYDVNNELGGSATAWWHDTGTNWGWSFTNTAPPLEYGAAAQAAGVPLPPAVWAGASLLAMLGLIRQVRAHRRLVV